MSAFTDAVDRGLKGMEGVSSGTCPGCAECMEIDGYTDAEIHASHWHDTDMASGEGSFSWRACGVCGTTLGGNRNVWHWVKVTRWSDGTHELREIHHESDMCDDCALYLANGDEPSEWRES